MIELSNISRVFGTGTSAVHALSDVSLHVAPGTIHGVVGQSGAGKSTLLRTVNGLEVPDSGRVRVGDDVFFDSPPGGPVTRLSDADLRRARHRIGMIFQHFNLVGNRTVAQNVEFALEVIGVNGTQRRSRALEMLDLVGLAQKADDRPAQLSGGQRQRVGIARALATDPHVLLSDEATSALDPETTRSILDLIRRLSRELGITVLLITHEMDVIKQICDSATKLEGGRVVETGTLAELTATPNSTISADLFPVGTYYRPPGAQVIDVTYTGLDASTPVITSLARSLDLDISILGATVENIGGIQMGRTRIAVPEGAGNVDKVLTVLRGHNVSAWEVQPQEATQ